MTTQITKLKPVIYLDMDGVLADFEGWAASTIGPDWKSEIGKPNWGKFEDFPDLFSQLPVMPGAVGLYQKCCDLVGEDQVYVLTALPSRAHDQFPLAAYHKSKWISQHISPNLRVNFGPFAQHKQLYIRHPLDILIDDQPLNIDQWKAAGGIGVLYKDQPSAIIEVYSQLLAKGPIWIKP